MMAEASASPDPKANVDPLAQLIAKGDHREAVAMAARDYGAVIGRLCMAMLGSQAEAEEATQEALVAAYRSFGSYRGEGSPKAWILGIARKICAKRLATRIRQQQRLRLVHDADKQADLPDDIVEARRKASRVRAALEELRPSEREAVQLRYGSGLAYAKVAEACGIEEAAARKRVSRALAKLRSHLNEEGA